LPFLISDFEFVSDFEFRASDFQYKHKMTSTKTTPLLECRGIGKRFGGVTWGGLI
jgi:hypothetical protein